MFRIVLPRVQLHYILWPMGMAFLVILVILASGPFLALDLGFPEEVVHDG